MYHHSKFNKARLQIFLSDRKGVMLNRYCIIAMTCMLCYEHVYQNHTLMPQMLADVFALIFIID